MAKRVVSIDESCRQVTTAAARRAEQQHLTRWPGHRLPANRWATIVFRILIGEAGGRTVEGDSQEAIADPLHR